MHVVMCEGSLRVGNTYYGTVSDLRTGPYESRAVTSINAQTTSTQ